MYLLAPRLYEKCAQKLEHKYLIHYSCEEKPSLSFVHREFIKMQKKGRGGQPMLPELEQSVFNEIHTILVENALEA